MGALVLLATVPPPQPGNRSANTQMRVHLPWAAPSHAASTSPGGGVCRGVGTRLPSLDGAIPFALTQAPLTLWLRPGMVAAEGPATCGHTIPQAGPGWGTHENGSEPERPPALQPPFWTLLLKPRDSGSRGPPSQWLSCDSWAVCPLRYVLCAFTLRWGLAWPGRPGRRTFPPCPPLPAREHI